MGNISTYDSYVFNNYFGIDLPEHWDEKRLGYLASNDKNAFVDGPFGSDLKTNDYKEDGIPLIQLNNIRDGKHILRNFKYVTEQKKNELSRHIARPRDIVLAKMAEPVARSAIVSEQFDEYVIVADCVKMTPDSQKIDLNFLNWAINSEVVKTQAELVSTGTTRIRISLGELKKLKVPYPSHDEQTKIANFLDHETAKIDTLIEKQQQLIKLLKEKRQAVISHAVTKGLNPQAPMKDSGVEWLGEVPEHWGVGKLGYYSRVINGSTPSKVNQSYWDKREVPWLSSGSVNQYNITTASDYISEKALKECSVELLPVGTLVMGMIGQGKTRGMSAITHIEATINQNLAAIIPDNRLDSEYGHLVLQAAYNEIRECARGGNQAALNCELISNFKVTVPSIDEQKQIVVDTNAKLNRFDQIIKKTMDFVEHSQERRTALISAAVTGKIDVRNWQAPISQDQAVEQTA
ncbi:restriction endonuclease subunit S [Vibrio furnissii]|uniref:restriction endonuclease subunit S n=1 Tax=Vibrio furnissii TaxID=29494 RepID=UPI0023DA745A|nr:restriction endonuclease subunit S [Vibrio furnissii]